MIPLDQAQAWVLEQVQPLAASPVAIADALGLVTAEPIISSEYVPPFDNTAVDGFAVIAADTANAPVTLDIVDTIAAGQAPSIAVHAGQAIRIMTGAPMPDGADAVVMVEQTSVASTPNGEQVTIATSVDTGAAVRCAGEDMTPDQLVFDSGTVLRAGHLGVLATLGIETISCHRRPLVGVISTGDELVEGAAPLAPGQIRDSNRRALLALIANAGCTPIDLGLIRDNESAVEAALVAGADRCDAVVTSGGVSMGDFDYVKLVLSRIADMRWMQVAIKPAKPLAVGTLNRTPIFGLPGNPVSSMVSFELFARPSLRKMCGVAAADQHRAPETATVAGDLNRGPDGKTHFARVRASISDGQLIVRSAGGQGSHQLAAMAGADALAILPDGEGLHDGDSVTILRLHHD